MFFLVRATFIRYRWLALQRMEKGLWFAAGCAGYYFAYVHFLTCVGKYCNFCSDSSWICFGVIFLGIGGCYFLCVTVVSESFLKLFVIWSCLINRDIWRGIFAALAVVSAGYLNFVCISSRYLLVSCFSVAYCKAILFLCTVRNFFCEYFLWIFILVFLAFFHFVVVEL